MPAGGVTFDVHWIAATLAVAGWIAPMIPGSAQMSKHMSASACRSVATLGSLAPFGRSVAVQSAIACMLDPSASVTVGPLCVHCAGVVL